MWGVMTFSGMGYPFGQFGSALLAMLPPRFLCTCSLAEHIKQKSPWLKVNTAQETPKHQCVNNIVLITNPKCSIVFGTVKKFYIFWDEINTQSINMRYNCFAFLTHCRLLKNQHKTPKSHAYIQTVKNPYQWQQLPAIIIQMEEGRWWYLLSSSISLKSKFTWKFHILFASLISS